MVKIGLIKHMTHSFGVHELSEILINIFSRSFMLVITLLSRLALTALPPIFSDLIHSGETFSIIAFWRNHQK